MLLNGFVLRWTRILKLSFSTRCNALQKEKIRRDKKRREIRIDKIQDKNKKRQDEEMMRAA